MVSLSSLSKKNWFQGLCNQTVYVHVSTHVPAREEILKNITIILGSLRPIYCNRNPETLKQGQGSQYSFIIMYAYLLVNCLSEPIIKNTLSIFFRM